MRPTSAQTEEEATVNLNRINQVAQQQGAASWSLSFSFGRSLQVGAGDARVFCGRSWSMRLMRCARCCCCPSPLCPLPSWATAQASVLKLWSEDQANPQRCRDMAAALAWTNSQATLGWYEGPHPSVTSQQGSLRENFRGWRTDV